MTLPLYLAMTAGEFARCEALPPRIAWMACHFSPYGTGLTNCPARLPEGAILILNDRTPVQGHLPQTVASQLAQTVTDTGAEAVLLDLQRADCPETRQIAEAILEAVGCPVAITPEYAQGLPCPVFLPPPPLPVPPEQYFAPWQGRDIWLEAALQCRCFTVTAEGCRSCDSDLPEDLTPRHRDEALHCNYHMAVAQEHALFTLWRDTHCLEELWAAAARLGVSRCVGLYQELNEKN